MEKRGFPGVPCILCGETGGVRVGLEDLTLNCSQCEGDMDLAAVQYALRTWQPVVDWLLMAPKVEARR